MDKIRYLLYGLIITGIVAIINWFFPRNWSRFLQKTDQLFAGTRFQFIGLYIFGAVLFFAFVLLYGISFMASFGKADYPKGSENFTPALSAIIPAKDEEKIIGTTLDSFTKANYPKDKLELVVVASGSTDRTAEICREYQDRLNIQILTDPLPKKGKPAALNYGLKHASHEIIAVYDADTQLKEDTLRYLVRHFYNPEVATTSGPVMVRNWNVNKLTKGTALEFTYLSGTGLYHEIRNRLGRHLWVMGRNYAIRKEVIEEFGGWNEDALTEDLHLSAQLSAAKKKVKYTPHAFISENVPTAYETFKKQRRRWVGGYTQSLSEAMELDKRTVILRNLGMMHFGHIADFSVGAFVTAIIFWLVGDFYIMFICLLVFFFSFGMVVNAVRKYGAGKYRLLLYYFVYIFINLWMFTHQFKSYEEVEWDKTELD